MKIRQKLIVGFAGIALLVGVVGVICVNTSQKALQKCIGENSVTLAQGTLDKIDKDIYSRIERWKSYCVTNSWLKESTLLSNQEFQKLDNIQGYINEKDQEWISVPREARTPFMEELINNRLSQRLRNRTGFYEREYGYKVIGELFVTNKYGANIAQTGKTSDYYQADEEWWQIAKKDGFCIRDVEYDASADVYSTDIGIRVEDEAGNFLGVMKIVLNIEEVINIIKEIEAGGEYKTTEFKLLTKDGKLIYSTEDFELFEDISHKLLFRFHQEERREHFDYFIAKGDKPGQGDELLAHAHSKGYKDFQGLGWTLAIEHETAEIFAPVITLRNVILSISLMLTILAVIIGLLISSSISEPLSKLKNAIDKIGEGNLDYRIEVKTRDELGQLARAFNQMTERRKQDEEALRKAYDELEVRVEQRTAELRATHEQLVETARKTGMAEVATDVLHNVGNVLTSVNVTTESIQRTVRNSKVSYLADMVGLLEEHEGELGTFMTTEEQGRKLPAFLANLSKELIAEQARCLEALETLTRHVKHMADIIQLQQSHSRTVGLVESVSVAELVEDAIRINAEALMRHGVEVRRELADLPPVLLDRHKLLQILTNLIRNAKYAMSDSGRDDRILTIRLTGPQDGHFRIEVHDNGLGIAKENLARIFEHGFTTKKKGHGFGLHSTALSVNEMNGSITAHSDGPGTGAAFTLELPFQTQEDAK